MPRKQQGWITFQSSEEERQILEAYCQQSQRTKTEILRELVRELGRSRVDDALLAAPNHPPFEKSEDKAPESQELKDGISPDSSTLPTATTLRISARNMIKTTVKQLTVNAVSAEVVLEVTPDIELVSVITKRSAEQLGLIPGKEVYAIIKANNIMIASNHREN